MAKITKKIKKIHVKADLCNGCRMCELMCSLHHATPQLNSVNPARARIQIIRDPLKNVWLPVFAGEYTQAECIGRISYEIDNKSYSECAFCRASCPSRGRFVEPDSGLPLACDMCQNDPTLEKPVCVDWCLRNVLTYEEREVEVEADNEVKLDEMNVGLQILANRYGLNVIMDAVDRMAKKG